MGTSGYAWQQQYKVAILETDRARLPARIVAAQAAINARIAEIQSMNDSTPAETQAITDAQNGLRILIDETKSDESADR